MPAESGILVAMAIIVDSLGRVREDNRSCDATFG